MHHPHLIRKKGRRADRAEDASNCFPDSFSVYFLSADGKRADKKANRVAYRYIETSDRHLCKLKIISAVKIQWELFLASAKAVSAQKKEENNVKQFHKQAAKSRAKSKDTTLKRISKYSFRITKK